MKETDESFRRNIGRLSMGGISFQIVEKIKPERKCSIPLSERIRGLFRRNTGKIS